MFIVRAFTITYHVLQFLIDLLVSIFQNKRLKFFPLFIKAKDLKNKKTMTILKSPHINKVAQEQCHLIYFMCSFYVHVKSTKKFLYLVKKVKASLALQVQLKLSLSYSKKFVHYSKIFNANLFIVRYFYLLRTAACVLFNRIINYFGFYVFKKVFYYLGSSVG